LYPGIYPALQDILELTALVPLGPGWKGTDEDSYTFTETSLEVLQQIVAQPAVPYLGARDLPTVRILRKHGLPAELTGCPGWYRYGQFVPAPTVGVDGDLEQMLVSSPPRDSPRHLLQYILLVRKLAAAYPDASIELMFHRGQLDRPIGDLGRPWRARTYARNLASVLYAAIRRIARDEQITTHDASGSAAYAEQYHDADLHVGYRVHAHIPSVSAGTPSFLLQIDGRGTGVSESLETPGDVWASDRLRRPVNTVIKQIAASHRAGYAGFAPVRSNIQEGYDRMQQLVATAASNPIADRGRRVAPD